MAKKPASTSDRIINKSILLFNKHGIINTSVQRIADSLKISPGNITYHFKKKNDIIHVILDRLGAELRDTLLNASTLGKEVSTRDHFDILTQLHNIIWRYRFVFNSAIYLHQEDKQFAEKFSQMKADVITGLLEVVNLAIQIGWMKPIKAPNTPLLLIENMWFLGVSLLRESQLEPHKNQTAKTVLYNSNLHFYSLIAPHWNDEITSNMFQYLNEELLP